MPIDSAEFESDWEEIQSDFDSTFVWRGKAYPCLADHVLKRSESRMGGEMPKFELTIYVQTKLFASEKPGTKQILRFGSTHYTIVEKIESADGVQLTLGCERT